MKSRFLLTGLVAAGLFAFAGAQAQAFNFMHGCGCEPSCCAAEPSCCAAPSCCDPCDSCCKKHCGLLSRCHARKCCKPACCDTCNKCEPACSAPEPSCGAAASCCDSCDSCCKKHCRRHRCHARKCCKPSCCDTCNACEPACGCGG